MATLTFPTPTQIKNLGTPTTNNDATTKQYVDNLVANLTSTGTLGNLSVTGNVDFISSPNISLGSISNLHITGGSSGYVLKTDGSGNLSWAADSTNPAGSNTQIQFNDGGSALGASANLTFDKSTSILTITGNVSANYIAGTLTTNAQPSITSLGTLSSLTVNGLSNFGAVSNVKISGGTSGYVLTTNGAGDISWQAQASGAGTGFAGVVKNDFTANGSSNTFALTRTPSGADNLIVSIDGLIQQTGVYTLDAANLVFADTPTSGQKIEVTIFDRLGAGSNTQVLYNNDGNLTGTNNFTYTSSTDTLVVGNISSSGNISSGNLNSSGNITSQGGFVTIDTGIIAVAAGSAGIFNTGITAVNIGLLANVTLGSTTGNVSARGNLYANNFTATGNINISGNASISSLRVNDFYSNRTPIPVLTGTIIDQFPVNKYRSAKYTMRVNSDVGYQAVEVLLVHNNADAFVTIYGSISSVGYDIVTLSAGVASSNVEVYATTIYANTTVNMLGTYVAD